jgi:hypothetical protein
MPLEDQLKLKITSFLKYGGDGELNLELELIKKNYYDNKKHCRHGDIYYDSREQL